MLSFADVPIEVVEPCVARSQEAAEARPFVVQMHRVHSHIWHVQTIRESRLFGTQQCGKAKEKCSAKAERSATRQFIAKAAENQR